MNLRTNSVKSEPSLKNSEAEAWRRALALRSFAGSHLSNISGQLMTLEEEGALVRLVLFYCLGYRLPNSNKELSRLCKGASPAVIAAAKRFLRSEDGNSLVPRVFDEPTASTTSREDGGYSDPSRETRASKRPASWRRNR